MDRPDTVRDRQSIYCDRHVNQAVAVKRLQAAGLTLAAIQARLAGLPAPKVKAMATGHRREEPATGPAGRRAVGAEPATAVGGRGVGAVPSTNAGRGRFWAEPSTTSGAVGPEGRPTSAADRDGAARPMLAVALSPAATLLFSTEEPLTAADITGIRDAASVLLDYLDQLPAAATTGAHTDRKEPR